MIKSRYIYGLVVAAVFVFVFFLAFGVNSGQAEAAAGDITITDLQTDLAGCLSNRRHVVRVTHNKEGTEKEPTRVFRQSVEEFTAVITVSGLTPNEEYTVRSRIACRGASGGISSSWKDHGTMTAAPKGMGFIRIQDADTILDGCVGARRAVASATHPTYGTTTARVPLESFDDFDGEILISHLTRTAIYSVKSQLVCRGENGRLSTEWKDHGEIEAQRMRFVR